MKKYSRLITPSIADSYWVFRNDTLKCVGLLVSVDRSHQWIGDWKSVLYERFCHRLLVKNLFNFDVNNGKKGNYGRQTVGK